jgi:dTDP-4-amino-4,6-dideoxy-D-galactose acyltransferase
MHSRFLHDEKLKNKYHELYGNWITNSINRKIADKVYVARSSENEVVGFITCSINRELASGNIGLIAVSPEYHGKSIGSMLINKVHEFYLKSSISKSTVKTQIENYKAFRFYQRLGFSISKVEHVKHYWL